MTKLHKDKDGAYRVWGRVNTWPREGSEEQHERPDIPGVPGPVFDVQPLPSPAPGPSSPVELYPKGPYDPAEPTPWDDYKYPAIASAPALPSMASLELRALQWLKSRVPAAPPRKEIGKPGQPVFPRRDPLPPGRQLPAQVATLAMLGADPAEPTLISGLGIADALQADELQERKGLLTATPLQLLDAYLAKCGIRYFGAHEITWHKWRNFEGVQRLRLPPASLKIAAWAHTFEVIPPNHSLWFILPRYVVPHPETWPRIIPVLRILDRYRHWLGGPVQGVSGYRCPWYNEAIGGASDSRHMRFEAMDFSYDRGSFDPEKFKVWFEHLYRKGADGVGLYSSFVHLDVGTRGAGKAKNWDKR